MAYPISEATMGPSRSTDTTNPTSGPHRKNALFCLLCLVTYSLFSNYYSLHPTSYSLQPTAYSLQPTAYSLQPTAYSLQPTAYSLQPTAL
jgi:hypothetical protein